MNKRNGQTPNPAETASYGYNPVGSLDWIKYPNGNYTKYTYNGLNRLTEMVNYSTEQTDDANILSSFNYTHYADGQRACVDNDIYGLEIKTDWTYDNLNRLKVPRKPIFISS